MDGYVTIGTNLNTSMVDKQIALLENKLDGLLEEYEALEKATPFEGQTEELIKLGSEIDRTRNKIDKLKAKQGFDFSGIGTGIANATKKLAKFGLALFGIRATYGFIRGAVSTLTSQNDELAGKIDAIKNALAQSIAPVVEWVVNLVSKLIDYLGTLISELSGYDIFAKSSKSLKSGVKSAQDLKKTLSGVDELNIISGNTSGGAGGTSGGFGQDKNMLKKAKETAQRLKDVYKTNRAEFKKYLFDTMKDYEAIFNLGLFDIGQGLEHFFVGLGRSFGGLWEIIVGAFTGNKDKIEQGIKDFFGGLWESIKGLLQSIWGGVELWFSQMWKGIKQGWEAMKIWWQLFFAGLGEGIKTWWETQIMPTINVIKDVFVGIFTWLGDTIDGIVYGIGDTFKELFGGMWNAGKQFVDGIVKLFQGDFKEGIKGVLKGLGNFFISVINAVITALNTVISPIRALIIEGGKIAGKNWNMSDIKIPLIPKLAKGGIVNLPGRGVPIGGAIAGERGPEGVIPLTDASQMELLGQAIGKYISIDATIPIYVGNRQIAREIRQINEQDSFASNGG